MKLNLIRILAIGLILSCGNLRISAQTQSIKVDSIKTTSDLGVYDNPSLSNPASYPGGTAAISKYIADHFEYTSEMKGIKGRILATFVVEKNGSITNIKIVRSLGKRIDDEIVRLLNKMPKWKPAVHKGEFKRVMMTIPVMIG